MGALTTDERVELVRLRRENKVLQIEREVLKKATAFFPVLLPCRMQEVSCSGFYGWVRSIGRRSARDEANAAVTTKIAEVHTRSRGTYGSPRIHQELRANGCHVGRNRVARLMRDEGLRGCRPRPFRATTDSRHGEPIAPSLLERDFAPPGPDRVWASDITYIRTWAGSIDLPVVIDLWSRRVIGWSVADHVRIELVLDPFEMAVGQRVPEPNLIHHSDRGLSRLAELQQKLTQWRLPAHVHPCGSTASGPLLASLVRAS